MRLDHKEAAWKLQRSYNVARHLLASTLPQSHQDCMRIIILIANKLEKKYSQIEILRNQINGVIPNQSQKLCSKFKRATRYGIWVSIFVVIDSRS